MKRIIQTGVLLTILTMFSACNSDSQDDNEIIYEELNLIVLHEGNYLSSGDFTSKTTKNIRSQENYESLLPTYSQDSPELLNFTEGSALLVDMGQKNTGGYTIGVTSAIENNNHIQVNILLSEPGANCVVTQALTNPYQIVWIPNIKELLINESIQKSTCE